MNTLSVIKPYACRLCDNSFNKKYNLQRHLGVVHADEEPTSEESEQEESDDVCSSCKSDNSRTSKKRRVSESNAEGSDESSGNEEHDFETDEVDSNESSDEVESSSDLEDNTTYRYWLDEAKEATEDAWNVKYQKYINEGMSENEAKVKADMKTLWVVKRNFLARLKDFLTSYLNLKDDETYHDITWELEMKMKKDMDVKKVLNRVIPKYQARFDALFEQEASDADDENAEEEASDQN